MSEINLFLQKSDLFQNGYFEKQELIMLNLKFLKNILTWAAIDFNDKKLGKRFSDRNLNIN